MRKITIGLALLFGAMIAVPATSFADQEVCGSLDSGKINTSGSPSSVTMTAPAGYVITQYCVKAGSDESAPDGAVVYVTVDPPQASISVPHPSGKSVSHYSFAYEEPTTTTTTTTTTTLTTTTTTTPPSTTLPPSGEAPTTTTAEETTTTTASPVVEVNPPLPPDVASKPPAAPSPAPDALPSTGSSSWTIVLIALLTLGSGLGLIRIARREQEDANFSM